jgi:hypothetical protein
MSDAIIIFLVVLIIALIFANIFIRILRKDRKPHYLKEQVPTARQTAVIPEVITHIETIHEKNAMVTGNLTATNRKLELVNDRVANLERAVSEIAEIKIGTDKTVDMEKMDFRLNVLEQQIDEIKNPQVKENTFYGKKNDPMEDEIRSLVFNSKRKTNH